MGDKVNSGIPLLPLDLTEQIERGNCTLFVSEGISIGPGGIPSSQQLAEELAQRSNYDGPDRSLPSVAQYYEIQYGRRNLVEFVRRRIESASIQCLDTHRVIARLPFKVIITTGYDTLLEQALREAGKLYLEVVTDIEIPFSTEDRIVLLKLYGSISRPDSLVITEDDHLSFFDKRAIAGALKFYAAAKTLLFVSYNLFDRTFSRIHWEATKDLDKFRRRTFAIRPEAPDSIVAYWKARDVEIIKSSVLPFLKALEKHIQASEAIAQPTHIQVVTLDKRPYKFLDYYESTDADIFFGREDDTVRLAEKVISHRLVVLFGKSGVGKTSIIKAGLVHMLRKLDYVPIYIRSSDDPVAAIKQAVADQLRPQKVVDQLGFTENLRDYLQRAESMIERTLVLIIDQAEELTTRVGQAARERFQVELTSCLSQDPPIAKFLLSLREDFLAELHDLNLGVPDILRNRYRLKSFTREQAREAITEPALHAGVDFEPSLTQQILDDLSGLDERFDGIEPPHVQIVCDRLYDARDLDHKLLTIDLYERLGGTRRLLADYVDSVLVGLTADERELARQVLKSLVTSQGTKALTPTDDILRMMNTSFSTIGPILGFLVTQRLIRRLESAGAYYYELSHEYLVSKIQEWVDELEMRAKAVQDLLHQELSNWQLFGWLMEAERFRQINQERNNPHLRLGINELELLLRCVMRYGIDLDYWIEQVSTEGISVWDYVEEGIASENAETRSHTVELLARLGSSRAINYLSIAIEDKYPSVHARAVTALHEIGTRDALEVLREKLPSDMILIPAGNFTMGPGIAVAQGGEVLDEGQACIVHLGPFYIDRYPVTNREYKRFVEATGHTPPSYWDGIDYPEGKADHPVVRVSWYDAKDYAEWTGKRLPTEAEWEKAARGTEQYIYPWGNEFDSERCNTQEAGVEDTVSVYAYSPKDYSPYGVSGMAGNTWDWTSSHYRPYPYDPEDGREQIADTGTGGRVRRGGSWFYAKEMAKTTLRYISRQPVYKSSATSFRCVLSIPSKSSNVTQ